ncbi:MAG: hypothetical protein IKC80_09455 [Kiritimatiellae bacterium]|nr:hypothetical protein [Kiritimatiellia bacterium]
MTDDLSEGAVGLRIAICMFFFVCCRSRFSAVSAPSLGAEMIFYQKQPFRRNRMIWMISVIFRDIASTCLKRIGFTDHSTDKKRTRGQSAGSFFAAGSGIT